MLVTLAQLSQGGSRDRYRSASPAPSERSGRSRGARGACRGADRGSAAARAASTAHLLGCRGNGRARRGRGLHAFRAQRTVADCLACVRRPDGRSRRGGEREDRLHSEHWPDERRRQRAVRHERRRERAEAADAYHVFRTPGLVTRRAQARVRVRRLPQRRHLRREQRRERAAAADAQLGVRILSRLVAGWAEDRLRQRPPWPVRDERRRQRSEEAKRAPRGSPTSLPGLRRGGGSPSSAGNAAAPRCSW